MNPRNTETLAMRRDLLSYVTKRPRTAPELFNRLRGEWGNIELRRLWRMLEWLVDRGAVVKYDDKGDGYVLGKVTDIETYRQTPSRWIPQIEEHW